MNKAIPILLVLLLSATLAWMLMSLESGPGKTVSHEALKLPQPPRGGDFTLISASGPVSLTDFRGKVVLLYFGYTWCPDICPLNLSYLRLALDGLSAEEQKRVRVLFVSVDPERDSPQRLKEYTAHFGAEFLGVTGTPHEVKQAATLYGAAFKRGESVDSAMGYFVDHSAYTYLIDKFGRLRQTLDHATPPDRILAAIRSQLKEGEKP